MSLDQEGARFYDDDGGESSASPLTNQDQNLVRGQAVNAAVRFLLNATGDPANQAYRLEVNKNSGGWQTVPAASQVTPTYDIELGTGALANSTATPSYPANITADSYIFMCCTGRTDAGSIAIAPPTGWTIIAQLEGGTGTWGVDTGTRRVTWLQKDTVTGSESGTVSVAWASGANSNNTLYATILRVNLPAGYTLQTATGTGADTSNGTAFAATSSSSISIRKYDKFLVGIAFNTDSAVTVSSISMSATGVTFSGPGSFRQVGTTAGNDHAHAILTADVTAPAVLSPTTVAPTISCTANASTSGPAAFLRLRAVPAPVFVYPSSNIAAGGVATTARMDPPSGKTTSSFVTGRMWDDENGSDSIDVTNNAYTELAWMIRVLNEYSSSGDSFDFRVTVDGTPLDSYGVTPKWTIGTAVALSVATETDTALALTHKLLRTVGVAAETDTALALARLSGFTSPVGLATETEAASSLTRVKIRTIGLAMETNAAFALFRVIGSSTGVATETDTAVRRPRLLEISLGRSDEIDTNLASAKNKIRPVGRATETDQAFALIPPVRKVPTGEADETDGALSLGPLKIRLVGLATESDTALPLTATRIYSVGMATETDKAYNPIIFSTRLRCIHFGALVERRMTFGLDDALMEFEFEQGGVDFELGDCEP